MVHLKATISQMKKDSDYNAHSKSDLQDRYDKLKISDDIHRKALLEVSGLLGTLNYQLLHDIFDGDLPRIVGYGPQSDERWNGRLEHIYNDDALCVDLHRWQVVGDIVENHVDNTCSVDINIDDKLFINTLLIDCAYLN